MAMHVLCIVATTSVANLYATNLEVYMSRLVLCSIVSTNQVLKSTMVDNGEVSVYSTDGPLPSYVWVPAAAMDSPLALTRLRDTKSGKDIRFFYAVVPPVDVVDRMGSSESSEVVASSKWPSLYDTFKGENGNVTRRFEATGLYTTETVYTAEPAKAVKVTDITGLMQAGLTLLKAGMEGEVVKTMLAFPSGGHVWDDTSDLWKVAEILGLEYWTPRSQGGSTALEEWQAHELADFCQDI